MVSILVGDAEAMLTTVEPSSVRCCVTSPPYFGLRDYGVDGQIGLEASPAEYVQRLVGVFRAVRRVMTEDGTLWLNLGDSYSFGSTPIHNTNTPNQNRDGSSDARNRAIGDGIPKRHQGSGLPAKNLLGIPWRVAFALQDDGWFLRSDIIWHKPNPMPESVIDRPTKSHEYLFLLSKSGRYFYDSAAIREPLAGPEDHPRNRWDTKDVVIPGQKPQKRKTRSGNLERKFRQDHGGITDSASRQAFGVPWEDTGAGRNARSVWTIATTPFRGAHFATFPRELARRCIVAGSAPGDTVLDPFAGSGTVGEVAAGHGRNAVLCELNPAYAELARERVGLMATVARGEGVSGETATGDV